MGARPLRRALRRLVEDPLSEKILLREFRAGDIVIVDADMRKMTFRLMEEVEPPRAELAGAVGSSAGETACWPLPVNPGGWSHRRRLCPSGTEQGNWTGLGRTAICRQRRPRN